MINAAAAGGDGTALRSTLVAVALLLAAVAAAAWRPALRVAASAPA